MPTEMEIKSRSLSLIETHLGAMTAKMYQDFYHDKSGDLVVTSARELLSEVIGEEKAEREIKEVVLFD